MHILQHICGSCYKHQRSGGSLEGGIKGKKHRQVQEDPRESSFRKWKQTYTFSSGKSFTFALTLLLKPEPFWTDFDQEEKGWAGLIGRSPLWGGWRNSCRAVWWIDQESSPGTVAKRSGGYDHRIYKTLERR